MLATTFRATDDFYRAGTNKGIILRYITYKAYDTAYTNEGELLISLTETKEPHTQLVNFPTETR